jgi:hypothetical protein
VSRSAATVVDLDPDLLIVAAHELGHAVLASAYGITVVSIEVDRAAYTGLTRRDPGLNYDRCSIEVLRAGLLGDVAGFEAERMWGARHGGHVDRAGSTTDLTQFARYRRRADLTTAGARGQARFVLRQHWATVERLAPRLARHGHVPPW